MNHANVPSTTINDDLEPQLEAAIWAVLSEPISSESIERVKSNARGLDRERSLITRPRSSMATVSRRWIPWVALAACVLLVIVVATMLPAPSNAFAQVIERIQTAGTFRYKNLTYVSTQEQPIESDVIISGDGRERRSMLDIVTICDASGRSRLVLIESTKSAIVGEPGVDPHGDRWRKINWFNRLKSYSGKADKQLGKMQIDGRNCLGFEVKLGQADYSIWVDAKTNDLVQVEHAGMPKGSTVTKSVMNDFAFDIDSDESLFSFDVPAGYKTITAAKLPPLLPFEESLVEALKGYTEASGGKFPKSIVDWGEWVVLLSECGFSKEKMAAISARLGSLLPTLTGMSKNDYDYIGAGKTVDDKRAIVFWYRTPEKQLRAVFNDLSVSPISETDLSAESVTAE